MMQKAQFHQVVIIGGEFGGLYAAKALRRAPVRATLVDKRNFHLFQPLLYQVATGSLSPGDIAYPLRSVFAHDDNLAVIMAEVIAIDVSHRTVTPTCVIDIRDSTVTMCRGKVIESLQAHTILWTAGVQAAVMGEVLAKHTCL
jgi:NADH dehydrogenase FAD-containing subunit